MRILRNPASAGPCVLVLGMFDGVHRGHGRLLARGAELARAAKLPLTVCTVEPHPLRVLRPQAAPPLLTTLTERAGIMAGFGVNQLCVMDFTRARADQTAEDFMAEMVRVYRPRWVVCGFNYTFGRGGAGDGETLRAYGEAHGFDVCVMPEVDIDGRAVSSTRIRGLLTAGHVAEANRLLGYAYTLAGRVVNGKHVGRTMGFPTANVAMSPDKLLPAFGVYACWLRAEGAIYPAVVNVGRHPTLPEGQVTVEAYALDECLQLYGKKVRLTFLRFLRPERRFDGVGDLRRQIARDAEDCRAFFQTMV